MKLLKKISLQWRITLLTAVVLLLASIALTVFSLYSADKMLNAIPTLGTSDYPGSTFPAELPTVEIPRNADASGAAAADETALAPVLIYHQQQFNYQGILFCTAAVLLGTSAIFFISGRVFKPLKSLDKQVSEIDENNLSFRFEVKSTNDEVQKLTSGFNHMLQRLEDAFLRQKRLTASVAHELKTPLTTMKAGMQVVRQAQDATRDDYMENIDLSIKNIDRLSNIVNDLLLISMAQENKNKANEEIYLDIMLDTVIGDLSQVYNDNSISFTSTLKENVISGQPAMIYRALYNLLENAYKYNKPNGSIAVTSYADGKNSYIEIADTGKGMDIDQLPFIFDAFYRVDNSRSRKIAGAGLGLSLVKTIIENHNGTIAVVSKPDCGTTFTVALPKGNRQGA